MNDRSRDQGRRGAGRVARPALRLAAGCLAAALGAGTAAAQETIKVGVLHSLSG